MGKVIAVWGSPGSGKSTVASTLAYTLAGKSKNVILIDTAMSAPQQSVWFPYYDGDYTSSLSSLMAEDNISTGTVSKRISTLSDKLGVLGFVKGEAPINLNRGQRLDKIKETYRVCLELADFVVIDCSSNILDNIYTIVALEQADRVVRVISPDFKGISFVQSNMQLISDTKFCAANHIVISNNVKSYHNVAQIEGVIGDFKTCLPHCIDLEVRNITGELFKPFSGRELSEYKQMLFAVMGVNFEK